MELSDRIRKLEGRHEPEGCPECASRIIVLYPGQSYPREERCPMCGQSPPGGSIIRVVYEGDERGA